MRVNPNTGLVDDNGSIEVEVGDHYKGFWSVSGSYAVLDVVQLSKCLYVCTSANVGVRPFGRPIGQSFFWDQMFLGNMANFVGPAGEELIPVTASSYVQVLVTARANLAEGRAVSIAADGMAEYADSNNLTHADGVVGVTLSSALIGNDVLVQVIGKVTNPIWTLTTGALVYVGDTGLFTNIAPATGFLKIIGIAVNSSTVILNPQPSIVL